MPVIQNGTSFGVHSNLRTGGVIDFVAESLEFGDLKVLVIPDKFKGTLTAGAAAQAIAGGWLRARPQDAVEVVAMSDGGDGFGEVMGGLLGAELRQTEAVDAAHRPCVTRWGWEPKTQTALVDSAAVVGLAMLPTGRFHPFELDTYGLGLVIRAAVRQGARRLLVGIGGSATNDAGFGVARALGWRFLDAVGSEIERWPDLTRLEHVERVAGLDLKPSSGWLEQGTAARPEVASYLDCRVAVDVQNRLLGSEGATRVYGPQKGLRPADFEVAERCLSRLAIVVGSALGRDFAEVPGAGAAGGLGFGFLAFLGGRLEPGFELFAAEAGLEARLKGADLVITGEGSIDASTAMGKGVGRIGQWCRELGVPCIALGGRVALEHLKSPFTRTYALLDLTTVNEAEGHAATWLERLSHSVAAKEGARDRGATSQ
jgi:glycerate 2-kinase